MAVQMTKTLHDKWSKHLGNSPSFAILPVHLGELFRVMDEIC